jgi:hypothetical protein
MSASVLSFAVAGVITAAIGVLTRTGSPVTEEV